MTLEELRLRVMAAFPVAEVAIDEELEFVRAALPTVLDLDVGAEPIVAFDAWNEPDIERSGSELSIRPDFLEDDEHYPTKGDWLLAEPEIERRILSVSAHQLIAARRRLALADAQ